METGTAYSYLINSFENLKYYDITSISTDYVLRLSQTQKELLYNEIRKSKYATKFEKAPQTEAQFHAYVHENAFSIRRSIFELLNEDTKDLFCFNDIAIVEYDCGIGLHSLAFIEYLKSIQHVQAIKEVVLIEEDSFRLNRAELLVKSMIPQVEVKTINKRGNAIEDNEIRLEHAMVYSIACSGNNDLTPKVIINAFEENRYLFAKLIEKKFTISGREFCRIPCDPSFYSDSDYSISERFDFDSVKLPSKTEEHENRFIDQLYEPSNIYEDGGLVEDNEYIAKLESLLKEDKVSAFKCYQSSKNAADDCILAKLNYIVCLIWGIGCDIDNEQAETLLKTMVGEYNGKIKQRIIRLLSICCKEEKERIDYSKQFLLFDIPESKKCGTRCGLASLLWETDKEQTELLYRQCVNSGCDKCGEGDNYDDKAKHCPRAQYWLSQLIEEKNPEESLQLLKESAAQGYKRAYNPLGCYYFNECKKEEDKIKATDLFIRAVEFGNKLAPRNAYLCLKDSEPSKALWYLALACKNNNSQASKAQEDIIKFIPKVVLGERGKDLTEEQIIKFAENGAIKYKDKSVAILLERVQRYKKLEWFDDALHSLDRLESLDEELAKQKREELEESIPDWYYDQHDAYIDDYSREDSLMDALDGEPDAYWNID